ncbi:Uncharacterized membrane protein [Marinactinospora thermotolerans DSM 45154]|uniref:Uncharacterized membrane protein n=1 Tax=Marinactinospora thermotolerans DSM 45154 TaxID=1122192 RepID=A0A1T4PA70_9ACTN|nr:DUF2243 domain-containing protein [Marinactinospora thermotolerans]SJZ88424.1 Uncharacterized membrane protein [Marinactinospora thermotolerans DSM 45154]
MAEETHARAARAPSRPRGPPLLAGVLLGVGAVAFVDEAVFHQILHWHHFYDRASTAAGLVSDGLFHAFSWFATVAGLYLMARTWRERAFDARRFWAGLLVGVGGFQLYDGIVNHKILRLHQIRYGVDILPYDLVWNIVAVLVLAAGIALWAVGRRRPRRSGAG